ncbi:MAG: monovalent cation:proton antiporter-2 (CPA2) family protein [Gammaproteobacteria bacterium]|jgi:monovalent cation:proton antiporter-2 (CPA2) family protein
MSQAHYFVDILIIMAAAVIGVPIFNRLRLGSVLGYLFAGAIIGPWGFGFIDEITEIRHIAEFGVIFLLFIIGIELKPARLWVMRRAVFGLGMAQVLITGLILTGVALLLGLGNKTAVISGFGLALSSTAFGLQILTEKAELGTPYGRAAFAILLLQDLAVVPLLALVSLLSQDTALLEGIEFAVLNAVLMITAVIIIGRFLLTPALHHVATSHNSEVFTAAAVLVVLGTAWLMDKVGLSMALGAFVAGLLLAESPFRHQVIADIQPFRGVLLGLFFMSVGMAINFGLLQDQGLLIVALVAALLTIKSGVLWGICKVSGLTQGNSVRVALLLSQSGEFAFVLFGLATVTGLMPGELFHLLGLVVALTMAATPLMAGAAERIDRRLNVKEHPHDVRHAEVSDDKPRVIIAGFGRVGRRVARILERCDISYLGLDSNPERVAEARGNGYDVFYGDASRLDVLRASGCGQSVVLVITLDNVQATERLVNTARQYHPDIPIYARARDREHCERLNKAGATKTISETLEASLQLGGSVLSKSGLSSEAIDSLLQDFRHEYYGQVNNADVPEPTNQ